MPVSMVRYEVAADGVDEVVAAVKAAFAALTEQGTEGIRYEYYRRAGSTEFVALLELPDGGENPLLDIPAAQELRETMAKWAVGSPPVPQPLERLGAY